MDKGTVTRLDNIVEHDVVRGFRIREVPEALKVKIRAEGLEPPDRIRLSAINPKRRRDISLVVQQQYHRDLKDPNVLSDATILELVTQRGEWSTDKKQRMEHLQTKTVTEMGRLWADGVTPDTATWGADILRLSLDFKQHVAEGAGDADLKATIQDRFDRWLGYTPERHAEYTAQYAASQGLDAYSVDRDFSWLLDHTPTLGDVDTLNVIDDLKDKQQRLMKLNADRIELMELQLKHARIFAGSAESRQTNCEEMAQLYFTCERVTDSDLPVGPLTATFDELWNYPDDAIRWLLYESYLFHNDIPDEAREYLTSWGFLKAEREPSPGANEASDELPDPPTSKTDIAPATATEPSSLASRAATS